MCVCVCVLGCARIGGVGGRLALGSCSWCGADLGYAGGIVGVLFFVRFMEIVVEAWSWSVE